MAESTVGYELYEGQVSLLYRVKGRSHWYEVRGVKVPGVTSVTGILDAPALMYWAVNCAVDYLEHAIPVGKAMDELEKERILKGAKSAHRDVSGKALTIGDHVHKWIERHIKAKIEGRKEEQPMPVNEEIVNCVEQFLKWERENHVKYLATERKIYSREYGYAGTLDTEAEVNGVPGVLDFKTSKGIWDEYKFQVAAYRQAREEETGREFPGSWILRLPKDGGDIETFEVNQNYEVYRDGFFGLLVAYRAIEVMKEEVAVAKFAKKAEAMDEANMAGGGQD